MTDWTQRIEELKFCDEYGVEQEGVKALMNEYAIERLEELKERVRVLPTSQEQHFIYQAIDEAIRKAKGQDK